MEQCNNKVNTLIINILFICFSFDWQKNLTALEFWRNVYVCGGCREGKNFSKQFIMDFAKVIKISLHLQR